ncbi:MAG: insulinase family protein [Micromonosporaceae bacterium]
MAIQQTEVDGVPTLVVPSGGPTVAGLAFRVGRADESLARCGITHMLEHLALFPLGLTDYHYNGTTEATVTTFHTTGSGEDIVAFFAAVCASLSSLPMHRLEAEKSIVRTELANQGSSVFEPLQVWRYGARGYGLLGYDEIGIHGLTPEALDEWSRTWFTRGNAVLWVVGEVPAGLRLPLPDGERKRVPEATSALPVIPAYFSQGGNTTNIAMQAVVRRRAAATVFAEVLQRNLFRDLRQDGGLSYSPNASVDPRGDGCGILSACVDALPQHVDAVLGGFIDTLAKLKVGRIEEDDVKSCLALAEEMARHPDAEAATLPMRAFELLTGLPVRDIDQRLADLRAVTVADVHDVANEVMTTALLMVPEGRRADWAGFAAAPTRSSHTVSGQRYRSLESGELSLHVAADGVSLMCADDPITVLYSETAAMLAWPDGARRLIGNDAFIVHIEPTLWKLPAGALAPVDAAVPADRVAVMPARTPDDIPTPSPRSRQAGGGPVGRRGWSPGQLVGLIASFVVATMLLCLAGAFTLTAATEDPSAADAIGWGWAVGTYACTGAALAPAILLLARRRRR